MFSCEYSKIFKNSYFENNRETAAPDQSHRISSKLAYIWLNTLFLLLRCLYY